MHLSSDQSSIHRTTMSLITSSMIPVLAGVSAVGYFALPKVLPSEHKLFREARLARSTKERPFALVTGSSAGIGYGIAKELCRHGFNVIIHGRNEKRLEEAVNSLHKAFPSVLVESICFDTISSLDEEDLSDDLKELLQPLLSHNLRLIVNNIGVGFNPNNHNDFAPFSSHSKQHITKVMDVNIRFTTYLTQNFLQQLEDNARDVGGRSMMLNISSISDIGIPYLAIYSASKAYITCFTKALDTEMKAEGIPIDMKVVIPGSVDSPNSKIGVSFTQPSSDQMGREIVQTIKDARSAVVTYPNWAHWMQTVFCSVQPYWLLQKMLAAGVQDTQKYRTEAKKHRTRTWRMAE